MKPIVEDVNKKPFRLDSMRALKYRNYRLALGGQGVSSIGTWMQRVAVGWLVYHLTKSPFYLGLVGFAGQIPSFLLGPVAGVVADRYDRKKIVYTTQILYLVQASLLWLTVVSGDVNVWQIIALSAMGGVVYAFDQPARSSFVVSMIENKDDVPSAVALNSTTSNLARLVGSSLGGVLVAAADESLCFLVNALSYVPVIMSLMTINVQYIPRAPKNERVFEGLKKGFKYSFGFPPVRQILLLIALVSLLGMPYTSFMPIFAKDIHKGGAHTLGFLMASSAAGALIGAIYLSVRKNCDHLGKIIPLSAALFSIGLITFSVSRIYALSLIFLLIAGWGMTVQMAASNTVLQTTVEEDKRSRVMGFFTMACAGMTPFGNLITGSMAHLISAEMTVMICGSICFLGTLPFAMKLQTLGNSGTPITPGELTGHQ